MKRWMLLLVAGAGFLSCGVLTSIRAQNEATHVGPDVPSAEPFTEELLETTGGYEGWWCATEAYPHVAPTSCRTPQAVPSVSLSKALDPSPHGKKLYYLFLKERLNETIEPPPPDRTVGNIRTTHWYEGPLPDVQPIGQVFVKQSWTAVEEDYERLTHLSPEEQKRYLSERLLEVPGYAIDHDAKTAFRTGEQRELFVMMKLDPATPGTDNGWVYGVLSPDGKQVLNAGRIESCMECHVNAPHDRLFGLK